MFTVSGFFFSFYRLWVFLFFLPFLGLPWQRCECRHRWGRQEALLLKLKTFILSLSRMIKCEFIYFGDKFLYLFCAGVTRVESQFTFYCWQTWHSPQETGRRETPQQAFHPQTWQSQKRNTKTRWQRDGKSDANKKNWRQRHRRECFISLLQWQWLPIPQGDHLGPKKTPCHRRRK